MEALQCLYEKLHSELLLQSNGTDPYDNRDLATSPLAEAVEILSDALQGSRIELTEDESSIVDGVVESIWS